MIQGDIHSHYDKRMAEAIEMPGADCYSPSATHGTLAIVANGSYELVEPGASHKPDFGHEKGVLGPQNTFHCAISF